MAARQQEALSQWQAMGRGYEDIQRAVLGETVDDDLDDLVANLLTAIKSGHLTRDVTVWRGVRSSTLALEVSADNLDQLVGRTIPVSRFMATTTSREIAESAFMKPPLAGGPVLIRVSARKGTRAAWVSLAGDPKLRDQRELLFGPPLSLRVTKLMYSEETPVLEVEVI